MKFLERKTWSPWPNTRVLRQMPKSKIVLFSVIHWKLLPTSQIFSLLKRKRWGLFSFHSFFVRLAPFWTPLDYQCESFQSSNMPLKFSKFLPWNFDPSSTLVFIFAQIRRSWLHLCNFCKWHFLKNLDHQASDKGYKINKFSIKRFVTSLKLSIEAMVKEQALSCEEIGIWKMEINQF